MIKKSVTINLESGLEARPIALLVQKASQHESSVYIETGDKREKHYGYDESGIEQRRNSYGYC